MYVIAHETGLNGTVYLTDMSGADISKMLTHLSTLLTGPSPPKDSLETGTTGITGTLCPHLGIAFRMFTLASDLLIHFPYVYRLGSNG
jgi:hypothetical protein